MKVWITQLSDCCGPVIWKHLEDVITELKELTEEMQEGDSFTVTLGEMTQEEFDTLSEFAGY